MKAVNCENVKSTLLQNKYPGVGVQIYKWGIFRQEFKSRLLQQLDICIVNKLHNLNVNKINI